MSTVISRSRGRFEFGLSSAQEIRAAELHYESIVFDMLSMQAGGNIFAHYPKELQADFQSRIASASRARVLDEAIYWPFEMSRLGKSDLLRDWLHVGGLTCSTFSDIRVHDGRDPLLCEEEERVLRYSQLPWLRLPPPARA